MSLDCKLETKEFYTIIFSIHDDLRYASSKCYISISFNFSNLFHEYIRDESMTLSLIYERITQRIESTIREEIENLNLREDISYLRECIEEIKSYSRTVIAHLWNKSTKNQSCTFMTGEPLTLSFYSEEFSDKYVYKYDTNTKRYDFNLMLEKYPTFWNWNRSSYENSSYDKKYFVNTDYVFFIAEISKADDEYWEFAITLTKIDYENERYFLGGRFKFIVKEGDHLDFIYYKNYEKEEFKVTALITKISRNKIELRFLQELVNPFIQKTPDSEWTRDGGWREKIKN